MASRPLLPYPIAPARRWPLFWAALLLTIPLGAWLRRLDQPLRTPVARGIVAFELAGTPTRARAILAAWDSSARRTARTSLLVDFPFLAAYSTALSVACALAGAGLRARGWPLGSLGVPLAWAQWGAGAADAVEDVALLRVLGGAVESGWPAVARRAAVLKFSLIGVGFVYALAGLLAGLLPRARHGR